MTSNLGSQYAFDDDPEHREEHYMSEVHKFFKPEFINRVDEIIVFNALGNDVLAQLRNRLKDRDINLTVSDSAMKRIIACGVDPLYGARPMKRHIQREIETAVAKVILENPDINGKTIHVDANDEKYIVTVK